MHIEQITNALVKEGASYYLSVDNILKNTLRLNHELPKNTLMALGRYAQLKNQGGSSDQKLLQKKLVKHGVAKPATELSKHMFLYNGVLYNSPEINEHKMQLPKRAIELYEDKVLTKLNYVIGLVFKSPRFYSVNWEYSDNKKVIVERTKLTVCARAPLKVLPYWSKKFLVLKMEPKDSLLNGMETGLVWVVNTTHIRDAMKKGGVITLTPIVQYYVKYENSIGISATQNKAIELLNNLLAKNFKGRL